MQRVKTGIFGLDEMLRGGFLPQSANLVEGAPGTGKSTLGVQFIYSGVVKYGEPGLILTFEEFPQQYYHDAASFGWDLPKLEREGLLKVIMTSPEISKSDLENVGGRIEAAVHEIGARRILVDSLSHFERLTNDPVELRSMQYAFINALKREGLTSLLTKESEALLGQAHKQENVIFVVDSYLLLRYVEIESMIHKALLVLKMRGSDHAKDIRRFQITSQGIDVQAPFEGQEAILSGSPRRRLSESFVEAFVRK
jgi:circadian clock protein KaiC